MIGVVVVLLIGVAVVVANRNRAAAAVPGMVADPGSFSWDVARSVAAVEGRRFLRNPALWAALALGAFLTIWQLGDNGVRVGLLGMALLAVTVVGGALASTAATRDRGATAELVASLPNAGRSRIPGQLLAILTVVTVSAIFIAVFAFERLGADLTTTIEIGSRSTTAEAVWEASIIELVQGPLAVAMAMTIGVALSLWFRNPFAGMLVVVALFFSPLMWMLPMPVWIEAGPTLDWGTSTPHTISHATVAAHVVYQVGFIVSATMLAVLKHDRRPWAWLGLIGALAVAVGAAIVRESLLPW